MYCVKLYRTSCCEFNYVHTYRLWVCLIVQIIGGSYEALHNMCYNVSYNLRISHVCKILLMCVSTYVHIYKRL